MLCCCARTGYRMRAQAVIKRIKVLLFLSLVLAALIAVQSIWDMSQRWLKYLALQGIHGLSPYALTWDELRISPLSLGVTIKGLKAQALAHQKDSLLQLPSRWSSETVEMTLHLRALLRGQLELRSIFINQLAIDEWKLSLDSSSPALSPQQTLERIQSFLKIFWQKLPNITQDTQLILQKASFKMELEGDSWTIQDFDLNLNIQKKTQNLKLQGQAQLAWHTKDQSPPVTAQLSVNGLITKDSLHINEFHLTSADQEPQSHFYLEQLSLQNYEITAKSLDVQASFVNLRRFLPTAWHDSQGECRLTGNGHWNVENQDFLFKARVKARSLVTPFLALGDIQSNLEITPQKWQARSLEWKNQSFIHLQAGQIRGSLQIHPLNINIEDSDLNLESLDLQGLFQALGLKSIPVWLQLKAQARVQGPLYPNLNLHFPSVTVMATQLKVFPSMDSSLPIVRIQQAQAEGQVTLTSEKLGYQGLMKIGSHSRVHSSGNIWFKSGFGIDYKSERLQLEDISPLSGLDFAGRVAGEGQVQGDSRQARFYINSRGQDLSFSRLKMGEGQFKIQYAKGVLTFDPFQLSLPHGSKLDQLLRLDFPRSEVAYYMKAKNLKLPDLAFVFQNDLGWTAPYWNHGSGPCSLSFQGPLSSWRRWDLQADCQFQKNLILNEFIEEIRLQLLTQNQWLTLGQSYIRKGPYRFPLTGRGHMEKDARIDFQVKSFPIQQLTNISLLKSYITGYLNYDFSWERPFGDWKISQQLQLQEAKINGALAPSLILQSIMSSEEQALHIKTNDNSLIFDMQLASQETKNSWSELQLVTKDFNVALIASLIGKNYPAQNFQSAITTKASVRFPKRHWHEMEGSLYLERLQYKIANSRIELETPYSLSLKAKEWQETSPLKIKSDNKEDELKFSLRGPLNQPTLLTRWHLPINLFEPWLPFIDSLAGRFQGEIKSVIKSKETFLEGGGVIKYASALPSFLPYSLNDLEMSWRILQNQLLVEDGKARLLDGTAQFSGILYLDRLPELHADSKFKISQAKIQDLSGLNASIDADLELKGQGFPLTLSGQVTVSEGKVLQDIDFSSLQKSKSKSLLPALVTKQKPNPIQLLVHVDVLPVSIRNTYADGNLKAKLIIKDNPNQPKVLGLAEVEPGSRILYQDRIFFINQGQILFQDIEPPDPKVYLTAQTRIERYEINLTIQGTLNNPNVALSSNPSLPEREILSLIAFGNLSQDVDRALQRPTSELSAATQVGSVLLQNIGLIRKAQQVAGISIQLQSEYNPDQNVELRKITIQKRLGEKTRISAATGDFGFREFRFEYRLSDRLRVISRAKQQDFIPGSTQLDRQNRADSVLGLDLEFQKGFR